MANAHLARSFSSFSPTRQPDVCVDFSEHTEPVLVLPAEATNNRVAYYSIASLLVCVASGVWQLWYLRRFFQRGWLPGLAKSACLLVHTDTEARKRFCGLGLSQPWATLAATAAGVTSSASPRCPLCACGCRQEAAVICPQGGGACSLLWHAVAAGQGSQMRALHAYMPLQHAPPCFNAYHTHGDALLHALFASQRESYRVAEKKQ